MTPAALSLRAQLVGDCHSKLRVAHSQMVLIYYRDLFSYMPFAREHSVLWWFH